MAEAIYDSLGPVLTRWTMGAAAAPVAQVWKAEIGSDPAEAELRLLALSGQFLGVAVVAEPPGDLRVLPDVPALALPALPDPLRPLARRLLEAKEIRRGDLLHFLAGRGRTMHPGDWMPAAGDEEAPDVYAPWRDWAEAATAGAKAQRRSEGGLTADNWEDFWPAARKAALAQLRRRDPDAARALIEAKFAGEGADSRLRMLGLFEDGLGEDDAAFLEAVATGDRAPKVKALAATLLARLGRGAAAGDEAAELAGFFELRGKGLLRRTQVVAPRPLKTPAQHRLRQQLLGTVDFTAFAGALGLSAEGLAAAWSWGEDHQVDSAFVVAAARSAPDAIVAALATALVQGQSRALPLVLLAARLAPAERAATAGSLLRGGGSFSEALGLAGAGVEIDDVTDMPAAAALLRALTAAETRPGDQAGELQALGLIASRAAATGVLESLTYAAGLLQADPRLDMLRLNAALDDTGGQG